MGQIAGAKPTGKPPHCLVAVTASKNPALPHTTAVGQKQGNPDTANKAATAGGYGLRGHCLNYGIYARCGQKQGSPHEQVSPALHESVFLPQPPHLPLLSPGRPRQTTARDDRL